MYERELYIDYDRYGYADKEDFDGFISRYYENKESEKLIERVKKLTRI